MRYIKFYLLAVCLWLLAIGGLAQTNVLRVESMKYPAGKTLSLPVALENQSDITGVQFDISIPFELVANADGQLPVTLAKNRAPYHQLAVRDRVVSTTIMSTVSLFIATRTTCCLTIKAHW